MSFTSPLSLGQRLVRERLRLHLSQEEVAQAIGTTARSINRWEHDKAVPHSHYRQQLCHIFQVSSESLFELFSVIENSSPTSSSLWTVPFRRNPFFTGRESILSKLHTSFHSGKTASLAHVLAISGLGGIGKTQTAVEYAYRFGHDYTAVFWINAETYESINTTFSVLAVQLGLVKMDEQDQTRSVTSVKCWFNEHTNWLLIFDNVEDLATLVDFLPLHSNGYVLLTTRSQSTGSMAQRIDLPEMDGDEGALLLLRRAKLLADDTCPQEPSTPLFVQARDLSRMLGGLPLALDQAGAYIEETGCRVSDYIARFQSEGARLLHRRGDVSTEHPDSVNVTFSLCFEKLHETHSAAADLLHLCAFLAADAIPEEIITEGAVELGPMLQQVALDPFILDDVLATLRRYSLLHRHSETKTLAMHRLVQTVLIDKMDENTRRQWVERTVKAVNHTFPDIQDASFLPRSQYYLSHAQVCVDHIIRWQFTFPEAARLLHQVGVYFLLHSFYQQAEGPLRKATALYEQIEDTDHLRIAEAINDLALLYYNQAKYSEAEPLFLRSLDIAVQGVGPEHSRVAETLCNLALLYRERGKYSEAESLFLRALAIRERILGSEHPQTALSLSNLALLYLDQGRFTEAEPLFERALAIREQKLGAEHPHTISTLNHLAVLYRKQGKFTEAEPLFLHALTIRERVLGSEHLSTVQSLSGVALLYREQGRFTEAEPLFERALAIREQKLGAGHPLIAQSLHDLAVLYLKQERYTQAEPLFQRALDIRVHVLGAEHTDTIQTSKYYIVCKE